MRTLLVFLFMGMIMQGYSQYDINIRGSKAHGLNGQVGYIFTSERVLKEYHIFSVSYVSNVKMKKVVDYELVDIKRDLIIISYAMEIKTRTAQRFIRTLGIEWGYVLLHDIHVAVYVKHYIIRRKTKPYGIIKINSNIRIYPEIGIGINF